MAHGEDEDEWDQSEQDYYSLSTVNLDCLMPNGIIIQMHVDADSTIARIKQLLWTEARKYAFYSRLKDLNLYVLASINKHAEKIELLDNNQRLSDAELFRWFVLVREKKDHSTRDEKYVSGQIGILIGRSTQQFDTITNPEVSEFRKKMGAFCENIATDRDRQSWHAENKFLHPPNVSPSLGQNPTDIPPFLANLIEGTTIEVDVSYNSRVYERVPLNVTGKASDFVADFLDRWSRQTYSVNKDSCLLKVCGREDYFYDDYTFIQYTYIRRCIARDTKPKLAIQIRDCPPTPPQRRVPSFSSKDPNPRTSAQPAYRPPPLPPTPQPVTRHRTSWDADVKDDKFKICVNMLTNGSCADQARIQMRLGIYHGSEPMCRHVETQEAALDRGSATWRETLTFDLKVSDIPRMARLCMTLCSNDRKKLDRSTGVKIKGKKEVISLAWANIPIFDYQGCMQLGPMPLYLWGVSNDDALKDDALNPIGTVEGNPQKEQCVCVNITFFNYGNYASSMSKHHIYYPSYDKVIERAAQLQAAGASAQPGAIGARSSRTSVNQRATMIPELHLENLRKFVSRDPLAEQLDDDEDECKKIWNLRYEYQFHLPASLPRLLHTVQWNNQANVAEMQALLQVWQKISPTQALELLDFAHADNFVRSYAVKCLGELSDCELLTYLLQLVQVLKYESYIDCDLVRFLLERALHNQTVGHSLFWLLRSEMHVPSVSVRFGLILEAYLKGNIKYLDGLLKQVNHLQRLAAICKNIKEKAKGNASKESLSGELGAFLDQPQIVDVIRESASILDPCLRFGNPLSKKCKVMMSKMKPLYLAFKNLDPQGNDIFFMYKKGDDLRQDMLTLQIIRIMDNIWQNVGLDLRLNAYGCLATGHQEGLIEVVTECDTIANIQKKYADGRTGFSKGFSKECIYRWLKEKNPTEQAFNRAMEEFTLSCAGYSVATYVLGIGDRHSDNLLLKENGQLLHIDFGHILGHFKQKMGFQRERVPFVLTPDFVYVICRGPKDDNSEFKRFKSLCEKAYMALRQQSHILLVLFLMMVNTGIPELSSLKESTRGVRFLLTSLLPQESEEKARAHWNAKLTEALSKSFWSSLNNAFHLMNTS